VSEAVAKPPSCAILLLALPLVVLMTGCATVLQHRRTDKEVGIAVQRSLCVIRADAAAGFVAATAVVAAAILTIVVLHMGAN